MAKIKQPLISLIVLNYNGYSITTQCITSLLKTDYSRYEIIIVDNGSTDNSFNKLKRKYANSKKIKVVSSKHNNFWTGGCNTGIRYTKGEKVFFLNAPRPARARPRTHLSRLPCNV